MSVNRTTTGTPFLAVAFVAILVMAFSPLSSASGTTVVLPANSITAINEHDSSPLFIISAKAGISMQVTTLGPLTIVETVQRAILLEYSITGDMNASYWVGRPCATMNDPVVRISTIDGPVSNQSWLAVQAAPRFYPVYYAGFGYSNDQLAFYPLPSTIASGTVPVTITILVEPAPGSCVPNATVSFPTLAGEGLLGSAPVLVGAGNGDALSDEDVLALYEAIETDGLGGLVNLGNSTASIAFINDCLSSDLFGAFDLNASLSDALSGLGIDLNLTAGGGGLLNITNGSLLGGKIGSPFSPVIVAGTTCGTVAVMAVKVASTCKKHALPDTSGRRDD